MLKYPKEYLAIVSWIWMSKKWASEKKSFDTIREGRTGPHIQAPHLSPFPSLNGWEVNLDLFAKGSV